MIIKARLPIVLPRPEDIDIKAAEGSIPLITPTIKEVRISEIKALILKTLMSTKRTRIPKTTMIKGIGELKVREY
jgi:hypothetical protein